MPALKSRNFSATGVKEIVISPKVAQNGVQKSTPKKGPQNVRKGQLPILSYRRRISDPM